MYIIKEVKLAICRLELNTVDRFGMTHDVSSVFVKNKINIIYECVYIIFELK